MRTDRDRIQMMHASALVAPQRILGENQIPRIGP